MEVPTFAKLFQLKVKRLDLKELPQTTYDVIRYERRAGDLIIILDNPNDGVLISVIEGESRTTREGLNTPQKSLKAFSHSPSVYQLEDRGNGAVLGYLFVHRRVKWFANYNKKKKVVTLNILEPSNGFP